MRPITLLLLLAAPVAFSQTSDKEVPDLKDPFKLPRFERTFGVAYETGGQFSFAERQQAPPPNWEAGTGGVNGFSVFYEQQINKNEWGYSIGLGVGAQFAGYNLRFSNPEELVVKDAFGNTLTYNFGPQESHTIQGTVTPIMLDIPMNLSYAIRLRPRSILRPYMGIRIRNIVGFGQETAHQYDGQNLGGGTDTTFSGHVNIDYGTGRSPRILGFATIGVKHSYRLKNGGSLNGFLEYNLPAFNQVHVRFSDFNTRELVSIYFPGTGQYEDDYFNFELYQGGWPNSYVAIALKMSAFRFGVSYSLPERKENRSGK